MLSLLHPLQGFRLFQWFTRYYPSTPQSGSIYDLTVNSIDGEAYALSQLKGKVRRNPEIPNLVFRATLFPGLLAASMGSVLTTSANLLSIR